MNKTAPWNVRGVGLDTREAAREAARRAGLSLGDWLDQVIAEEANTLGLEAEDIGADDRLEAVTAKLARMNGDPAAPRKSLRPRARAERPGSRETPARPPYEADETAPERAFGFGDAGPVPAWRGAAPDIDAEALLDAAIARMETRGKLAQRQTAAALENVSARLGEIETHITARRDETTILPIKSALGRLEERLDALSRRPAPQRADPRVEASLRDLTERLDEVAEKIDRSAAPKPNDQDAAHFQRLESKLASLITHLSDSEQRRNSVAVAEERARKAEAEHRARAAEAEHRARAAEAEMRVKAAEAEQRIKAVEAEHRAKSAEAEARAVVSRRPSRGIASAPFADTLSDIDRRQRELDAPGAGRAAAPDPAFGQRLELIASRMEKAADAASGAGQSNHEAFNNLQSEIGRLAKRLDDMRSEARRPAEIHPDVLQLKRDITSMSQAVAELAPRGSVAALETAVRDLAARIELSRQDGARENLLAPVEALVADLQATLKDFDPRSNVIELEREIKLIGHKVETMTLTGFDPEAFKRIHSQSQEIRDLLTAAASRPLPVEKIERQIAALGARVETLALAHAQTPQPDVTSAIGEIRTMFDRAMVERAAPSPHIAALEKRLETLAHKIDQAVARPAPQPAPAPPADTSGIEKMIARFAERMETARQSEPDPKALESLQRQIAIISQKLDRSDAGLKSISSIEHSISNLFAGLENSRAATLTAAESAARAAAIEAAEKATRAGLREVMQNMPQPAQSLAETQEIKRDLVDLRSEQDATGKRAHAALHAVHVTLEKVVDRLASIEVQRSDFNAFATVEEARRAAAAAARDSVQETLARQPAPVADTQHSEALQRGIVELRAEHIAAGQRTHATMSAVHSTLEKVVDRLATLESTQLEDRQPRLDETRALAAEAARAAAREVLHEAMDRLQPPPAGPDPYLIKSEVADLRALQEEAGERTHSTLKAVHQTLEKVVDRLTSLEDENNAAQNHPEPYAMPARDVHIRAPAEAKRDEAPVFAPAPRRFEMVVDPETLRPQAMPRLPEASPVQPAPAARPASPAAPQHAPAAAPAYDGPDMLLEPGSGFPPHRGAGPALHAPLQTRVADSATAAHAGEAAGASTPASFIAAARRAAQAAAAEAAAEKPAPGKRGAAAPDAATAAAIAGGAAAKMALAKSFVSARKKPILIGLTGLVVVLGAAMALRSLLGGGGPPQKAEIDPVEFAPAGAPEVKRERSAALQPAPQTSAAAAATPVDDAALAGQAFAGQALAPQALAPQALAPQALTPAPQAPLALSGAVAPIAGDAASRSAAKSKQQVALLPSDPSPPAGEGRPVALPRAGAPRSIGIDQAAVGSIDGKSGSPADPALAAVSAPLREAALGGSAAAQYEMGLRFAEGRSVPRDLKTAAVWLEKAAGQGFAPAQYRIGSLYEKGLGVARDIAQAKNWYVRAAEAGNMRAMHNLAVLTAEGAGSGKPDYTGAAQWFKKAAELGVRDSQYNLAILYARGLGIELNLTQSYTWFSLAANQGDEDAAKKRDEVAGKMDAKALADARAAVTSYRAAATAAAANEAAPPAGGWDAAAPKPPETGRNANKV